jgi:hypothetical protein
VYEKLIKRLPAVLSGPSKYGLGFKGGWPYSSNYSDPKATLWDAKARSTLDFLTGNLGIRHAARWHNEPRSQAEWDAWGYWLHGGGAGGAGGGGGGGGGDGHGHGHGGQGKAAAAAVLTR